MDFSSSEADNFTDFGVYTPLTQRDYFTSAVFSSSEYFARLGNKILTPLIISGKAQQQKAEEQQKQMRRGHARTMSKSVQYDNASNAINAFGGASPSSTVPQKTPSQVAESLVDLHEEALEMLEKLRLEEQQRLVEHEKACAITESSVRGKLSRTRDEHCVSSVSTLNKMENLANAALTVTAGVRAEMAAASNRIARGRHVLQLFEIFDACTSMDEIQFQSQLAELAVVRHEAREGVLAQWRNGAGGFGGDQQQQQSISAAAIHGNLYFQQEVSSPNVQQQQQQNDDDDDDENGDGTNIHQQGGSASRLQLKEQQAIEAGMPEILARRSRVPDALEILRKLVPLAEEMMEQIPNARNILDYDLWFRQQLTQEILQLMSKFCELHGVFGSSSTTPGGNNNEFSADDDQQNQLETRSAAPGSSIGIASSRLSMLRAAAAKRSATSQQNGENDDDNNNNFSGSKQAERQAENRRLILLSSVYAKLLMASLDFVSRLHCIHHETPDVLVMTLREFIVSDLKKVAENRFPISPAPVWKGNNEFVENALAPTTTTAKTGDEQKTTDNDDTKSVVSVAQTAATAVMMNKKKDTEKMTPAERVSLNSREAAQAYDYFIFELLWDLTMIEAMFGNSYPGVRAQLSSDILDRVVCDFSKNQLNESQARRVQILSTIDKLQSTQARYYAEKIIAELNYHNEFLATIISHVQRLHIAIVSKFDDLRTALQDAFAPILSFGDAYAKEEYELKQLTRLLRHQTEFHLRDFAVPPDGSAYDLVPAHEETMKLGFDAAETALKRAKLICRPKSVALVSSHLAAAFQSYVASFVERELQKACDMLRREAATWSTWPQKMPKEYFDDNNPIPDTMPGAPAFSTTGGPKISVMEPLFCAMRLCRWGLSSLARLSRFMQFNLAPRLARNPELVAPWIQERTRITINADQVGQELLTYIGAGVTTRSLALLSFIQQGADYVPSETGTTADLGSSGTRAALHYQHFLTFALQEAEPLLKQIHAASTAEQELKTSAWDRQRHEAILASRQKGEALRRILKNNKICSGSFILSVGFGLFKGLCCHLRSYPVNDIGVLIMKRDVSIYRNAVNVLFKHATSEENLALSEMFDVLKELMNLLMVPLDNIRNVKSTGLLKEFHHKDIVEFLQMRNDIGKALSDALKL